MRKDINQPSANPTTDPEKEIRAWKAYFAYAAQDMTAEAPELLVACAHRLLEMSREPRAPRRGGRRRAAPVAAAEAGAS